MIHKLLNNIKQNPHQIAVVDNGQKYTYEQLYDFALKFSGFSGKKIALAIPKSFEYVGLVLSSFLFKFTFIPLDIEAPLDRNLKILKDIQPDIILAPQATTLGQFKCSSISEYLSCGSMRPDLQPTEYLAYVIYTSGSTGEPKGVEVLNTGLENVISQQVANLSLHQEQIFFYVSILFDASISDMLCSFYSFSTLHIKENIKVNFKQFTKYCNEYKISYIDIPPSVLKYLNPEELFFLKVILVGGEVPVLEELKKWAKKIKVFKCLWTYRSFNLYEYI